MINSVEKLLIISETEELCLKSVVYKPISVLEQTTACHHGGDLGLTSWLILVSWRFCNFFLRFKNQPQHIFKSHSVNSWDFSVLEHEDRRTLMSVFTSLETVDSMLKLICSW